MEKGERGGAWISLEPQTWVVLGENIPPVVTHCFVLTSNGPKVFAVDPFLPSSVLVLLHSHTSPRNVLLGETDRDWLCSHLTWGRALYSPW